MAIIANRVKTFSIVPELLHAFRMFAVKFLSGGLILLSLALWYFSGDSRISNAIFDISTSYLINPTISVFNAFFEDMESIRQSIIGTWHAKQENISLKLENARLANLLAQTSYVHSENKQLKSYIKLSESQLPNISVTGQIISITNGIYKRTAIVNVGLTDGIKENQVVVADGGIVGRITHCANRHSTITIISDLQSRVPITTSTSGQRAIFAGDGSTGGELLYIADHNNVKVGETLFTSGDGKYYPHGLAVARIIKKDGSSIYAKPIVDLSNIKFVSILSQLGSELVSEVAGD